MRSFVYGLVAASLAAIASSSPLVERAPVCRQKSFGPFRLYAQPTTGGDAEIVKLIDLYTPRPTNDTISVLSVCPADDCGRTPAYWTLEDQVLYAVFNEDQYQTVGIKLTADQTVRFVTSDAASVKRQKAAVYCATCNTGTANGLPGFLSGNGSAEDFAECTNIPTVGTPERQDIWFKPNVTTGLEKFCKPVHLVMQSIGIIADPIAGCGVTTA